jgi:hypothetical protein
MIAVCSLGQSIADRVVIARIFNEHVDRRLEQDRGSLLMPEEPLEILFSKRLARELCAGGLDVPHTTTPGFRIRRRASTATITVIIVVIVAG